MAFNGAGSFSLTAGNPVVTGTTISSTTNNNTLSDIATGLSTCLLKDGTQTVTANIPMATFRLTGVGDATALQDAITAKQVQNSSATLLASVAGTNTITASATPTPGAYASGQKFVLVPAVTNTGATTVNVSSLGAKNIFWNGAACVGGELRASIPALIEYDGTQFHIIANGFNAPFLDTHPVVQGSADSTKKVRFEADGITTGTTRVLTVPDRDLTIGVTLGTEQATTSGTSIDFTGIPAGVRRITLNFAGVSTNGTANLLIQLGDSGGVEATGYLGAGSHVGSGGSGCANFTTGFGVNNGAATNVMHGTITLTLEDSVNFHWSCAGSIADSASAFNATTAGAKALSAELDRVRLTTSNGTDTFDAGAVNITYEQ